MDYKKYYIEEIKNCISDLKSSKTFYKQIPNLLTSFRIVSMIPLNILYFMGSKIGIIVLAFLVFLSDFFDGKIARKYNISSSFGADLDAISDKVLALGVTIPLAASNPLLIVNILLEMMIGMVNTASKFKGYDPKTNYVGKVKTWFLSLLVLTGYLNGIVSFPDIISKVLFVATACTEGIALGKYIDSYKKSSVESKKKENVISFENNKKKEENAFNELEYLKHERELIIESGKKDIKNKYKTRKKTFR